MATKKNARKNRAVPMLKDSAHEIYLAGLGAFALAGEEGNRMFRDLVKRVAGMEKSNKARLQKLAGRADRLQGQARTAVTRLATPIEAGMTNAMHRLGVPTRKEIATLTKRVEELTRVVAKSKARARKPSRRGSKAETVTA